MRTERKMQVARWPDGAQMDWCCLLEVPRLPESPLLLGYEAG